jgi:hypothetical protein
LDTVVDFGPGQRGPAGDSLGIYKLIKGRLRVCIAPPGSARPGALAPGGGADLVEFERAKPAKGKD